MTEGDIYRAGMDKDGYSTIESKDILYKYGEDNSGRFKTYNVTGDNTDDDFYKAEFSCILGSITAKDTDDSSAVTSIAVSPNNYTERNADYSGTGDLTFNASDFSGAQVLVYDTSSQKLKINSESVDAALGQVTTVRDGNPTKVLIYMSEGKVKLLCILPA